MINVTLITNNGRKTIFVNEDSTIKEFLNENRVNYAVGVTQLDGCSMRPDDLNKTFAEFGITDSCYLSVVVKADNAAKVTVVGEAAVITSGLKLDDVKTAKKYRPDALVLKDEDGEPYFCVGYTEKQNSHGAVGECGVTFSPVTDANGYATVTDCVSREGDTAKYIADKYGFILLNLKKVEEQIAAQAESIAADKAAIAALIDVQ